MPDNQPERLMTPEFRVSFPNVFRPDTRNLEPGKEPKFSISMLFPKGTDLSALKALAKAAAVEKWGDKLPKSMRNPFIDASRYGYEAYDEGVTLIRASSKIKPGLVYAYKDPATGKPKALADESEFYAGCYARATLNCFAYGDRPQDKGNKGVAFGLYNIQKLRDGEPLSSGRRAASDDFEPVDGAGGDDNAGSVFD